MGGNTSPEAITSSKETVSPKSYPTGGIDCCLLGLTLGVLSREVVAASDSGEGTSSLVTSTGASTGVVIRDVVLVADVYIVDFLVYDGVNPNVLSILFHKHRIRVNPSDVLKQQYKLIR